MHIGKRLKIARKAIGYTLQKAAGESGIGESSISDFENSKREPRFSQLSKLAETYRKTIEFFLSDEVAVENIMLWRDEPDAEEEMKKTEAEFRQLCRQYHNLELCTGEVRRAKLPEPDVHRPEEFNFEQAESFARKALKLFSFGEIPGASIRQILEEIYCIKIFYLGFCGSAISTVSSEFGPAILLNRKNKLWRRNYDLAHELFHILTWKVFRQESSGCSTTSEDEEKFADAFASKLLMPEDSLIPRLESYVNDKGQISLDKLDDIAREFGVSLDALIYRIASLYRIKKKDTQKFRDAAKKLAVFHRPRESDKPVKLPERYCDLAQRALREGNLSLMQFAKYMDISYKEAQGYLTEDEDFTDEKISISIA